MQFVQPSADCSSHFLSLKKKKDFVLDSSLKIIHPRMSTPLLTVSLDGTDYAYILPRIVSLGSRVNSNREMTEQPSRYVNVVLITGKENEAKAASCSVWSVSHSEISFMLILVTRRFFPQHRLISSDIWVSVISTSLLFSGSALLFFSIYVCPCFLLPSFSLMRVSSSGMRCPQYRGAWRRGRSSS